MIGRWDCSQHVDQLPLKDGVVGRCDVKDAELCDDVIWIWSDQKLNCIKRIGFVPIEFVEKRLDLWDDNLFGQLGSILHSI